jgi:hypothetical protein
MKKKFIRKCSVNIRDTWFRTAGVISKGKNWCAGHTPEIM